MHVHYPSFGVLALVFFVVLVAERLGAFPGPLPTRIGTYLLGAILLFMVLGLLFSRGFLYVAAV